MRNDWAHPRVGGDGTEIIGVDWDKVGSPPRGRGRPGFRTESAEDRGLTPAWAGTAYRRLDVRVSLRAHPRVGGDGGFACPWRWSLLGSPPRGRGRQQTLRPYEAATGLTPAWAGTAWLRAPMQRSPRAHPRVGGDGYVTEKLLLDSRGSPPRGRGRRPDWGRGYARGGLTPAWAGTAAPAEQSPGAPWAHPRVGGDGCLPHWLKGLALGSPPRGRGRLVSRRPARSSSGLTPAWAGTAVPVRVHHSDFGAHPRVGGDGPGQRSKS